MDKSESREDAFLQMLLLDVLHKAVGKWGHLQKAW